MKTENSQPEILAQWDLNRRFTWEDALAAASFYVFIIGPMGIAFYLVCLRFGIANEVPLRDQLHGMAAWVFGVESVVFATLCAITGKYLWLIAMSRVLGKNIVGPFVAYSIPRRISRFDKAIIHRFYR